MRICKSLSPKLEMQQKRRLITSTIDTNHAEILGCVLLILMDIFRKTEKAIGFFGFFLTLGFRPCFPFSHKKIYE